jgi:hypothetical protein
VCMLLCLGGEQARGACIRVFAKAHARTTRHGAEALHARRGRGHADCYADEDTTRRCHGVSSCNSVFFVLGCNQAVQISIVELKLQLLELGCTRVYPSPSAVDIRDGFSAGCCEAKWARIL